jgi:hypothetical protein
VSSAQDLIQRGSQLAREEHLDEAADCFQQAMTLQPSNSHVLAAYGKVRQVQRRFAEASSAYDQALAMDPENPWLHCYKGSLLLYQGQFEEAWYELEWYWETPITRAWAQHLKRPRWDGSSLADRTILLIAPGGGFGDNLMWARYVPITTRLAKRAVMQCPAELVRLFRRMPGMGEIVTFEQPLPEFDVYAPLMSLAHLLHMPDPSQTPVPYVEPDPVDEARWTALLQGYAGLRVGVVWSIEATHAASKRRSIPLEDLAPLSHVTGVTLFSLQRGVAEVGATALGQNLVEVGRDLRDFADTAALISQLDLVISVDTAVAHLAGALGRPLWLLLARDAEARWLLDRPDCPWYPTARLFRQPRSWDWGPVVEQVCSELRVVAYR